MNPPNPPYWFAKLLGVMAVASSEGKDVAQPGWDYLLSVGQVVGTYSLDGPTLELPLPPIWEDVS